MDIKCSLTGMRRHCKSEAVIVGNFFILFPFFFLIKDQHSSFDIVCMLAGGLTSEIKCIHLQCSEKGDN